MVAKSTLSSTVALVILLTGVLCVGVGIRLLSVSLERIAAIFGITVDSAMTLLREPQLRQTDGITNILVLGKGGEGHESPDLTDTIVMLSFSKADPNRLKILPLPRDIWSVTLQDKINSAYYYGSIQKREGGGIGFSKTIIEEITGLPVHYTLVLNFSALVDGINLLGGVPVAVSQGFTDTMYPIAGKERDLCNGDLAFGCRYTTIQFVEGMEIMTGERALAYVRSRHAAGDEGTDFARSRRQEEVLAGIRAKLARPQEWLTKETPNQVQELVTHHIETDIDTGMLISLFSEYRRSLLAMRQEYVSLERLLVQPDARNYEGRYVLVPRNSLEELQTYIKASISGRL